MKPDDLRANLIDKNVLSDAWRALGLLDIHVQKNFFGTVEGVDTVDVALDALAYPLARLFSFPLDVTEAPALADVLAYLASQERIERTVVTLLERVQEGIRRSTYMGLREKGIEDMEEARGELHDHLVKLLSEVEQEASDG